ncbi:MAG: hypothetical protein CMC08_06660 [Flavobacteriaceae bacterium]|nr:hypothetical protein [Flavobacteriaceae bacterium]
MKTFRFFPILLILSLVLVACGDDDDRTPPEVVDNQAPTAPANLTVSNVTDTSLQLTWEAADDNIGVSGYKVIQDGSELPEVATGTSITVTDLSPGTTYEFYLTAFDAAGNISSSSNTVTQETAIRLEFRSNLSEMGVFTATLASLAPAAGVQLYEINSTLFTDYAKKQRLIRMPEGQAMRYDNNDLLPVFPDNTLIAKTFYYNRNEQIPSEGRKIIETRIFLKINGVWEVGNYIWNEAQTEATYSEAGNNVPVSYIDGAGNTQDVNYQIPSKQDCFTCHNNNGSTFPIGMKLRSMNFTPSYTNKNQLQFLADIGLLAGVNPSEVSVLPDWTDDVNYTLLERGRAYLDVNCAHCHQPGGSVPSGFTIDFRYETPFDDTNIYSNRGEIEARFQSTAPVYRMPQLGRTVVHQEALQMLRDYLEAIEE